MVLFEALRKNTYEHIQYDNFEFQLHIIALLNKETELRPELKL